MDKKNTVGVFNPDGTYTNSFLEKRKLITPEWFNANKAELQRRITASGSNYKLNNIDQMLKGTSDFKPGILHDLVLTSFPDQSVTTPTVTPEIRPEVDDDVDPSGNN